MNLSRSSRGATLVAGLSLVAVLGVVLAFIESLNLATDESQTAATATVTTPQKYCETVDSQVFCDASGDKLKVAALVQMCKQKKAEAIKNATGQSSPLSQPFTKNASENNKCVAALYDESKAQSGEQSPKNNPKNYVCVGEDTKVTMDTKGQGTITSTPAKDVEAGMCRTQFCTPDGTCSPAKKLSGTDALQRWAMNPAVFSTLPPTVQNAIPSLGPLSQQQVGPLQQLYQQQQTQLQTQIEQQTQAVSSAQTQITNLAACGEAPNDPNCQQQVAAAEQNLKQQQDQLAALQKQQQELAAAQASLTPGNVCDGSAPCQPGQILQQDSYCITSAQPIIVVPVTAGSAYPSNCINPNATQTQQQPPTTTTFPPTQQNPQTQTGLNNTNGLSSLLSGLMRGLNTSLAQQQPAQQSAQACSTDPNTYTQQQQQYQQQLQQYNYQLQQYQYQQQLSQYQNPYGYAYGYGYTGTPMPQMPQPCSPSTQQQCSTQPQQPTPSACASGTWQPQYSGTCIVNWQCAPGSGAAPTASLSCNPALADVGQTIAVSYSCSAGTASSSAFAVTSQPSGSATTTLTQPPASANTATFVLTCNNQGLTAGAQCSVQINQPSIVLVANPKTVASGETSQLGWVTTGMQNCVISSPDQPNFTTGNSSNTSVAGTAITDPLILGETDFLLHCETLAGSVREATTTLLVR